MKKQPAVLYMIISILVLVIVGLTFIVVLQNSNQTEDSGTVLPQTTSTNPQSTDPEDTPPSDELLDEEILTPPNPETEQDRTTEVVFDGDVQILSGVVLSKNQTQIVIRDDVTQNEVVVETADTSAVEVENYLTVECVNLTGNVCQGANLDARTSEELN